MTETALIIALLAALGAGICIGAIAVMSRVNGLSDEDGPDTQSDMDWFQHAQAMARKELVERVDFAKYLEDEHA